MKETAFFRMMCFGGGNVLPLMVYDISLSFFLMVCLWVILRFPILKNFADYYYCW